MGRSILLLITLTPTLLFASPETNPDWSESLALREKLLSQTKILDNMQTLLRKTSGQGENLFGKFTNSFPWKKHIMTTIFWIGEKACRKNPVPNDKSSWDTKWMINYGGYDCPSNRLGFKPKNFKPKLNPFYIALPYNDIGKNGTKKEAPHVIPWFHQRFQKNGHSVIKGQWIAIHYKGRICYAQWEDCGPFETTNWEYVFGNGRPRRKAGLDISPAVRDYLGLKTNDYTDWRFVHPHEVPKGPWKQYGENNIFSPYYTNRPNSPFQSQMAQK